MTTRASNTLGHITMIRRQVTQVGGHGEEDVDRQGGECLFVDGRER